MCGIIRCQCVQGFTSITTWRGRMIESHQQSCTERKVRRIDDTSGQDELYMNHLHSQRWASDVLRASRSQTDLRHEDGAASSWLATSLSQPSSLTDMQAAVRGFTTTLNSTRRYKFKVRTSARHVC